MLKLGIDPEIKCIEPPSYVNTAYVAAMWPSFFFDSFVKIWATCEIFMGKWFTAHLPPPAKHFPYAYDRGFSKDFTIPLTTLFVSILIPVIITKS